MSVFKVKLQNVEQGLLDLDPSTHPLAMGSGSSPATYGQLGEPMGEEWSNSEAASRQRQMFVAGPGRTYRLLKDGETFTDNNYWKRFAYPQVGREFAFIEVVTDDGSIYSDVPEENTFAAGATETLSTDFADTAIDFVTTYGGAARFLQVQNLDATIAIEGELNGDTNVTFRLNAGETQIFNQGDLAITLLRLKADSGTPDVSWIASVRSVSNS
jgi:hypothetical protein